MSYPHSISRALSAVRQHPRLVWIQLIAGVALAGAAYGWLLIPEAAAWQIAASGTLAIILLSGFLLLNAGTICAYAAEETSWPAFAGNARRLPALFVWLAILIAGRELLYFVDVRGWAIVIASWLTLNLQRPVAPAALEAWLLRLQAALDWIWLAAWLPFGREVVRVGFAAFRGGWRAWQQTITSASYWLAVLLLWAVGAWLPEWLVNWVPDAKGLWLEFTSLALRFLPAIALALLSWLTLLALVAQHEATGEDF